MKSCEKDVVGDDLEKVQRQLKDVQKQVQMALKLTTKLTKSVAHVQSVKGVDLAVRDVEDQLKALKDGVKTLLGEVTKLESDPKPPDGTTTPVKVRLVPICSPCGSCGAGFKELACQSSTAPSIVEPEGGSTSQSNVPLSAFAKELQSQKETETLKSARKHRLFSSVSNFLSDEDTSPEKSNDLIGAAKGLKYSSVKDLPKPVIPPVTVLFHKDSSLTRSATVPGDLKRVSQRRTTELSESPGGKRIARKQLDDVFDGVPLNFGEPIRRERRNSTWSVNSVPALKRSYSTVSVSSAPSLGEDNDSEKGISNRKRKIDFSEGSLSPKRPALEEEFVRLSVTEDVSPTPSTTGDIPFSFSLDSDSSDIYYDCNSDRGMVEADQDMGTFALQVDGSWGKHKSVTNSAEDSCSEQSLPINNSRITRPVDEIDSNVNSDAREQNSSEKVEDQLCLGLDSRHGASLQSTGTDLSGSKGSLGAHKETEVSGSEGSLGADTTTEVSGSRESLCAHTETEVSDSRGSLSAHTKTDVSSSRESLGAHTATDLSGSRESLGAHSTAIDVSASRGSLGAHTATDFSDSRGSLGAHTETDVSGSRASLVAHTATDTSDSRGSLGAHTETDVSASSGSLCAHTETDLSGSRGSLCAHTKGIALECEVQDGLHLETIPKLSLQSIDTKVNMTQHPNRQKLTLGSKSPKKKKVPTATLR